MSGNSIGAFINLYNITRKSFKLRINHDYMLENLQCLALIAQLIPVSNVFPDYKYTLCPFSAIIPMH